MNIVCNLLFGTWKLYYYLMSPQPKSYLKLGLVVLFLICLVLLSAAIFRPKVPEPLISPTFLQSFNLTSTFSFVFKSEGLSKIIGDNLAFKDGEYAIYIEDLTDGEKYGLRDLDTFPAASLYKLYLMAAVLKEVENGNLRLDQNVSRKKSYLVERFGGVDFGYEDIPEDDVIGYSVEEALTRVGRISDNFASIILADKIGWEKLQEMADLSGAQNTSIEDPISTSALDIGEFFKKLYKREIISGNVSDGIIKYLELNQLNNRIPAGLPEDAKVIHKTGELGRVRNDAGIVWLNSTPGESPSTTLGTSEPTPGVSSRAYVIVLMSKDLKDEDEGVETLAKISKDEDENFKKKYEK